MWPGFGSALGAKAASSDQPWHLRYPAIRGLHADTRTGICKMTSSENMLMDWVR